MVVPGYFANDARDAARRSSRGYWRSGDIGALDEAATSGCYDRLKDMINRAGYKVFSAEVENVLASPSADRSRPPWSPTPMPVLGEKVHAFVTTRDGDLDCG